MLTPADDRFAQTLRGLGVDASPAPPSYLEEPRGLLKSSGALLARPRDTAQVARILAAANDARVGVIPYGGGTGLVGGQLMPDGPAPLVLSLDRMAAIRRNDPQAGVLVAEAGCTLQQVQEAAASENRLFPLSLASEGSCRIGGNLATNAGGVQVLRYGNARDLCLGLEMVLADGSVHHGLSGLRKDNTGYDLRHLMIGSEGSLGVITAAALRLFPRPTEEVTGFAVLPDPQAAVALLARMQEATGGLVSAFELISGVGFEFLRETAPETRRPFDPSPPWMALFEAGAGPGGGIAAQVTQVLETAIEDGLVEDVLIAQNETQRAEFWTVRETIPEANKRTGAIASHDISLPITSIPAFVAEAGAALARIGDIRINCFGHLGDGNLHYNAFPPPGQDRGAWRPRAPEVTGIVYDLIAKFGGSISAEHGIGRLKTQALAQYGDPAKLAAMAAIKGALDPNGILNPGAVVPVI